MLLLFLQREKEYEIPFHTFLESMFITHGTHDYFLRNSPPEGYSLSFGFAHMPTASTRALWKTCKRNVFKYISTVCIDPHNDYL